MIASHDPGDGVMVRRRRCEACGHGWYTAQEPEYLLRADQVVYSRKFGSCKPCLRESVLEQP